MKHLCQVDIAPTIAHILGISIPEADGRLIEDVEIWRCQNVILVIIDSLGYDLYRWLEPELKNIPLLSNHGLVLRAKAVTNHTSPAIASILRTLAHEVAHHQKPPYRSRFKGHIINRCHYPVFYRQVTRNINKLKKDKDLRRYFISK